MSDYNRNYDDRSPPRRYKSSRTRPRESDDPDYMEESTYVERGKGRPPTDLMTRSRDRRDRDRDDSVESIRRDFPPPGASRRSRGGYDDYDDGPRRTRSAATSRRDRDRDRDRDRYSDDWDDYGPAAAGGAAGAAGGYAAASRSRGGRSSRRDRNGYDSEDDRSPPRKDDRRKSGIEGALEGLGLGGILGAIAGKDKDKDSRDRSRSRSRARGNDRDRSRSRGPVSKETKNRQWAQAAQAALVAGAIEAFKSRKEPGSWTGDKGKRIATAAISAGGIDRVVDKDPDRKSHRHLLEAVVGGLATSRLANGPNRSSSKDSRGRSISPSERPRSRSRSILDRFRSKSRGRGGSTDSDRSRDRSKGRDGDKKHDIIKDLVAGGALAATGKKIYDSVRSKSKDRRRRSPSRDSYEPPSRNRRRRDVGPDGPRSRSMPPPDDKAVVGPQRSQAGALAAGGGAGAAAGAYASKRANENDTDSESSTDLENQKKKMTRKEIITAGLALVATIHAAHGVYNGIEASHNRHKLVEEGKMSVEEARKKKSKALLQDAAAVGIAALGIKGAYSEWKEMNEKRHNVQELEDKRRRRQKRREARLKEERLAQMHGAGGYGPGALPPSGNGYPQASLPPPPMGSDRR